MRHPQQRTVSLLFPCAMFLLITIYRLVYHVLHGVQLDGGRGAGSAAPERNGRQRGQGHHHYPVAIGRVAQAIVGDRDSGDERWNAEGEIDDDEDRSEQPSALVRRS